MTSPDAYDSTPPRGTELAWTRLYRQGGRYAHLRSEDSGLIACPAWRLREHGTADGWLGTGSQREYDKAAGMPTCPACFRFREASLAGITGAQFNPAERRRQL